MISTNSFLMNTMQLVQADANENTLSTYDLLLYPFMWVIGWVMRGVHELLVLCGLPGGAGITWVLSIVGLTVVVRLILIPLFIKQIKAGRAMQMAQPELKIVREKYKGKRDQMSMIKMREESKEIQKKYGTSTSASCLPMLVQIPVFFSLYRLLYNLIYVAEGTFPQHDRIGGMGKTQAMHFWESKLFGQNIGLTMFGEGSTTSTKILISSMVVLLMVTMFLQTKYLMLKNMADEQLNSDNPMVKSTKYMLYFMPLVYLMTGPVVQIGLLVYWVASNIWMIFQQYFIIRAFPMRGSAAARWREEAHEIKFEKYRLAESEKLEEELEKIKANEEGLNPKGVEVRIRNVRREHIHKLSRRRMELGLDDINLGSVDKPEKSGQRMQPGRKGWEEYQAQFKDDLEQDTVTDRDISNNSIGKDGLTPAQRAQKQAERRAAQRKAAAQKRKSKVKKNQNKRKGGK